MDHVVPRGPRWYRCGAVSAARRVDPPVALSIQIALPVVHQPPPTLEQIRARIRPLDVVRHHVRQCRLDDLPRMVGPRGRPVRNGPRPRSRGATASSATSTPRSACHSASGTPDRCRRRASARPRGSPPPARRAEPRCSRFAFLRSADIVHTRPATSISSHVASRTSADLAAVSTRNSNASLTGGAAEPDVRSVSTAAATSPWGSASRCVTMSSCGPRTGRCGRKGCLCRRFIAINHSSTVPAFSC